LYRHHQHDYLQQHSIANFHFYGVLQKNQWLSNDCFDFQEIFELHFLLADIV